MNYHQEAAPFSVGLSAGFEKTDGYRTNGDMDRKDRLLVRAMYQTMWQKI